MKNGSAGHQSGKHLASYNTKRYRTDGRERLNREDKKLIVFLVAVTAVAVILAILSRFLVHVSDPNEVTKKEFNKARQETFTSAAGSDIYAFFTRSIRDAMEAGVDDAVEDDFLYMFFDDENKVMTDVAYYYQAQNSNKRYCIVINAPPEFYDDLLNAHNDGMYYHSYNYAYNTETQQIEIEVAMLDAQFWISEELYNDMYNKITRHLDSEALGKLKTEVNRMMPCKVKESFFYVPGVLDGNNGAYYYFVGETNGVTFYARFKLNGASFLDYVGDSSVTLNAYCSGNQIFITMRSN